VQQPRHIDALGSNELLDALLEELNKRPEVGGVMRAIREAGYQLGFVFIPGTWASEFEADKENKKIMIRLGRAPMPAGTKNELLYLDHRFSDVDTLVYRSLHELAHALVWLLSENEDDAELIEVFEMIVAHRKKFQKGFTTLGNLTHYQNDDRGSLEVPAREDLVELIAMRLYDPRYSAEYLEMLQQTHLFKEKHRLATIDAQESEIIKKCLSKLQLLLQTE
jgi:hypothetical protein